MSEQHKNQEPIPVSELAERFLHQLRRIWALVLVLVGSAGGGLLAKWRYAPRYESSARFSVSSPYQGDDVFSAAYYDTASARQLAEAFPHLLEMDLMKDLLKERLGTNYIDGVITPYSVANTNMFVLKVESGDPQRAYDILTAVIDCFPRVAMYMAENPRVEVLDQVQVPTQAINPFSMGSALVRGGLAGLAAAMALAALLTVVAKNVTSLRQLRSIANLSVLATFPRLHVKKRRRKKEVLMTAQSDQGFAEALRGLGLKVRKHLQGRDSRIIVITSTTSGEGKTTTAANLSMALAEGGSRVVLVDGDLRNQSIGRLLGAEKQVGLLNCLRDNTLDVLECLQKMPGEDVMYLSGESAADWHYAIDRRRMQKILNRLQEHFDYVVLDTAPTALVSDTAQLCRFGGCVLYVVRADWARESQVIDQVMALHDRDVELSGFVYNGAPRNRSGYGYGYGSYGYGYGYKKK